MLAALLGCLISAGTASAGTLDQQQTTLGDTLALASSESLAQTFTAGISGGLDEVDLHLAQFLTPTYISVEIRDVSAGVPGSAILASRPVAPDSVPATSPGWVSIGFAPPAPIVAGTKYALVAYTASSSGYYAWTRAQADAYPGGEQLFGSSPPPDNWMAVGPPDDLAFKTYVVPSPPTSTGQRAAALAKCKHKRRAKRKRCRKRAKGLPL
jgi:hypothetical protein